MLIKDIIANYFKKIVIIITTIIITIIIIIIIRNNAQTVLFLIKLGWPKKKFFMILLLGSISSYISKYLRLILIDVDFIFHAMPVTPHRGPLTKLCFLSINLTDFNSAILTIKGQ